MKRHTTRTRDGGFSGHDKRVTLNLARLSATCAEMPELLDVLESLPGVDYDLTRLSQASLELLYAEFDERLEDRVKNEFEADPSYLNDLRIPIGTCPLCGHRGCRFIFRIVNLKGGRSVECGSECIITYGLSVKGAETAAHAKKLLEKAIRQAIRKAWVEEWHKEFSFRDYHFDIFSDAIEEIGAWPIFEEVPSDVRIEAKRIVDVELPRLRKFYDRCGWLNTKIRWGRWLRLVQFVKDHYPVNRTFAFPEYKPWEPRVKRLKEGHTSRVVEAVKSVEAARPALRGKEEVFELNLRGE